MRVWLALLLTAAAHAAPLWTEAESYTAATGDVVRIDPTANDYGAMARSAAGGQAFLRIGPGARLSYAPFRLDAPATLDAWVRAFPMDSRRVTLELDGRAVGTTPGGDRIALTWSRVGTVELTAGEHRLALRAADGNAKYAYLDAALLAEPGLLPTGRTVSDLTRVGPAVDRFTDDFAELGAPTRWHVSTAGDQWVKVIDDQKQHAVQIHNGTGLPIVLTATSPLKLKPGEQVRVRFQARCVGITESVTAGVEGVGGWSPPLRRDRHVMERVLLVPANAGEPFLPRFTFSGGGDTMLSDVVFERPSPPVSPFETGRFLPPPNLRRAGRLFELERYVTNADTVTDADVDGDGKWTLVRLARDENVPMFSRGTALKSDSRAGTTPLRLTLTGIAPGPYSAWLGDPGRPMTVTLGDGAPIAAPAGRQTSLGRVEITDGTLRLTLTNAAAEPTNPGPAYADYVLLIPVENHPFVDAPVPARPATAPDGAMRDRLPMVGAGQGGVLRGGFPVPQGRLGDPAHARVLAGDREVPAETRALSRWADGSVQWLLVTARPAGDGPLSLEYGRQVHPAPLTPMPISADGLTVDGRVRFATDGSLLAEVRGAGATTGPLSAVLTLADGTVLRPTATKVRLVEHGALRTVVEVTGRYAAGERSPFGLACRVTIDAGTPGVAIEHTFIADRPGLESIRSLRLELAGAGATATCPELGGAKVERLRLLQDATNPFGTPTGAHYVLTAGAGKREGETAAGEVGEAVLLHVDDFPQQYPMALDAEPGKLAVELWPADAAQGPFVAHGGMAKTHRLELRLGGAAPGTGRLELPADHREPLFQPGILEPMAVGADTAAYDALLRQAYDRLMTVRAGYGMENWGDVWQDGYVRGAKTWSNQEWDLVNTWLVAWARLGDPRYFAFADAAARHYRDVDCAHLPGRSDDGSARTHVHTSDIGHQLEGPNFAHAGWAEGLLLHYHLTGDERSRDAALRIADWLVRLGGPFEQLEPDGPPYELSQNRPAGWPLTTLGLAYRETGDPRYLRMARRLVDYLRRCQIPGRGVWEAQTPHEAPWRGGCVFAFTVFKGLDLYRANTGDAGADADRVAGARWLLGEVWRPGDRYEYEQCPVHANGEDVGYLMWEALARASALTGDPLYLLVARDGLERRLAQPDRLINDMVRSQWSNGTVQQGARLLAALRTLPGKPVDVGLESGPTVTVAPGGDGVLRFQLVNRGTTPLERLRVSVLCRGEWRAEANAPARVAPGETAELAVKLTAPPPLTCVPLDNDTAYLHLVARFEQQGTERAVWAWGKATAGS